MKTLHPSHFEGTVEIPASKSQTIRAFLIATFARSISTIRHPLISSDTEACISACRQLGAKIEFNNDSSVAIVDSTSAFSFPDNLEINCLNSGTTEYLLLPMLSTINGNFTLFGDKQLNERPVGPLVKSLRDLGADVQDKDGKPPVKIVSPMIGGNTVIECKTSQYLSGLLLASPLAKENTCIDCSLLYEKPYVELTLGWLRKQNIEFEISDDLEHAFIKGGQKYKGFDEYINGDYSSASFFFCLAAINGSSITVKGLDKNDPQGDKKILEILEKMGCTIKWEGNSVTVTGPRKLKGGEFDLNSIPDTLPILSVVASFACEPVHLTNVPQARIKETDRIATMRENLSSLGIDVKEEDDGLLIKGGRVRGGRVRGFSDHRIIMALSILSSSSEDSIIIDEVEPVAVTFPTFFEILESIRK